nr:hypothetical protein [uncultured Rhodopila sp.]
MTTRKGSGLADALTDAVNGLIANGAHAKLLDRWSLGSDAIEKSRTNPPGLPQISGRYRSRTRRCPAGPE